MQLNEEENEEFYVELKTDFLEALVQQSIMQQMLNKWFNIALTQGVYYFCIFF